METNCQPHDVLPLLEKHCIYLHTVNLSLHGLDFTLAHF